MSEITPLATLYIALGVGFLAALGMALASIWMVAASFLRRVQWKDEVRILGKIRTTASYVIRESNWAAFPRIVGVSFGGGVGVGFVVTTFGVGLYNIFLV